MDCLLVYIYPIENPMKILKIHDQFYRYAIRESLDHTLELRNNLY